MYTNKHFLFQDGSTNARLIQLSIPWVDVAIGPMNLYVPKHLVCREKTKQRKTKLFLGPRAKHSSWSKKWVRINAYGVASMKVIYPKYSKNSNELAHFCFWTDLVVRAVLKNFCRFLKYATFFLGKTSTKLEILRFSFRSKK